jgi:uncharacterized protein YbaP (TraB family)
MQRQIIVMFLSLFCLAVNPAWADAGQGQARGALFKVQAKGSANTLYLFGTMHVGLPEFYPLEPRIGSLVARASVLALEIDAAANPAGMAAEMARHAMLAPGARDYADLPAAQRLRLDQLLAKRQIPLPAVYRLKPWLLASVLVLGEFTDLGYRADLAVDSHLAQLARQNKVKVIELESAGAQLALFNRLPEHEQWRFLEESIDGIENGKQGAQVRHIVDAYRLADQSGLDEIAKMAEEDDSVSGKFMKQVVIDERNVQLADKVAALLQNEPNAVAAVGVLHLVGKRAIPQLLKEKGFTVERMY